MLILSRRKNESIHIGDDVVITVLNADRGQARIGIEAPKDTPVFRTEIYKRIRREKSGEDADGNRV